MEAWLTPRACPGFFIGGKTERQKIEAEGRERDGIIALPTSKGPDGTIILRVWIYKTMLQAKQTGKFLVRTPLVTFWGTT